MPDPTRRPATFQDLIAAEAKKQGIDPRLALAVAETESSFDPTAISPKGARGLMQLMPATAAKWQINIDDPVENIRGGILELKALLDEHQGDVVMALRRYNASPNAPTSVTDPYVQKVLGRLQARAQPPAQGLVGAPPPRPTPLATLAGTRALPAGWQPGPPPDPRTMEPPVYRGGFEGSKYDPAVAEYRRKHNLPDPEEALSGGFDPRTREGRRNIAGAVGSMAAATPAGRLATVPGLLVKAARLAAPAAGAAAGGALAETGEQLVGTSPPDPSRIARAAGEEAAYEVGGGLFMWPFKAAGRGFLGSKIGETAAASLRSLRKSTERQLDDALDAATQATRHARTALGDGLTATQEGSRRFMEATRAGVRTSVDRARELAGQGVEAAKGGAEAATAAAQARYESLIGRPPPSPRTAGRAVIDVVQGPAQSALEAAGQAVADAAARGPNLTLARTRAKAQQIFDQQIKDLATHFSGRSPESGEAAALIQTIFSRGSTESERAGFVQRLVAAGVPVDVAEATIETARHPAMGVIRQILNAPESIPFRAAHQLKRQFDEAVNWDSPAKKSVQQITKGLRSSLREEMTGHAPYDQATAAYERIIPIYREGLGAEVRQAAIDNPESLVHLIRGNEPTRAAMFRDLLLRQAAEGGGAAEGRLAWDAVRASWTYERVIKGGIKGLTDRIDKLDPDFRAIFYGDPAGQQVLGNLKQIHDAWLTAIERGTLDVADAQAAGQLSVRAARQAGAQALRTARDLRAAARAETRAAGRPIVEAAVAHEDVARRTRQALREPTAVEEQFLKSSIASRRAREAFEADLARVGMLSPTNPWFITSAIRLLNGPQASDLMRWAAFSSDKTQALVALLTTPALGQAAADVIRLSGLGEYFVDPPEPMPSHESTPPTARSPEIIGTPPPGARALRPSVRVGEPPPPFSPSTIRPMISRGSLIGQPPPAPR